MTIFGIVIRTKRNDHQRWLDAIETGRAIGAMEVRMAELRGLEALLPARHLRSIDGRF